MVKSFLTAAMLLCLGAGCEGVAALPASDAAAPPSAPFDRAGSASANRVEPIIPPTELNGMTSAAQKPADPAPAQAVQRQVIYSAGLRIVVVSLANAMKSVESIARDVGGYLQESDAHSITIRVPAGQFDATLEKLGTLGEVVDRNIKASDVTEQYQDLQIRLDNAKKTRDRLLEHLKQSTKLEDTIKLEAEIGRVSTEIETLEGKMRFLQSQIAMSTIRVELNSPQPQLASGGPRVATPFEWIGRLGDGLVAGNTEILPRQPRIFAGGPKFDPPAGFVRYFASPTLVEAMDADGVRIKLQRQDNFDKAPIEFWTKLARKALVEGRAVAVVREGPVDGDSTWSQIVGTREVAGQSFGYLLAISRTNDYVFTFEAWAPKAEFDRQLPAMIASAKSLRR